MDNDNGGNNHPWPTPSEGFRQNPTPFPALHPRQPPRNTPPSTESAYLTIVHQLFLMFQGVKVISINYNLTIDLCVAIREMFFWGRGDSSTSFNLFSSKSRPLNLFKVVFKGRLRESKGDHARTGIFHTAIVKENELNVVYNVASCCVPACAPGLSKATHKASHIAFLDTTKQNLTTK